MTNRVLVYTGTISYGLYLLHKIAFDVGQAFDFRLYPILALPVLLGGCYDCGVVVEPVRTAIPPSS